MSMNLENLDTEKADDPSSWGNLHPQVSRQIRALFKKQFLLKIRHWASILEYSISFILIIVLYVIFALAKTDIAEETNPAPQWVNNSFPQMAGFLSPAFSKQPNIVLWPDCPNTRFLVEPTTPPFLNMFALYTKIMNCSVHFVKDEKQMEDIVYATDDNAISVYWVNAEKEDALIAPELQVFYQTLNFSPERDVLHALRTAIAYKNMIDHSKSTNPEDRAMAGKAGAIFGANFSTVDFATPAYVQRTDIGMAVAIFAVLPVVFATMADLQTLFEEKDHRITGLAALMGCSEIAYWVVNFVTPFVLSFVPYFILGLALSFGFALVGTDFSLVLVATILFLAAHICFQNWLTTYMKKGSSGRALSVFMLVFCVFFALLHSFFTLDPAQTSAALKHIFSIIPFSAYQMLVMSAYSQCRNGFRPLTWSSTGEELVYPPWMAIMWLCIDLVLFFLLFLLFNLTNSRSFGSPPLPWREIFSRSAWRRLLASFRSSSNPFDERVGDESPVFLDIHGLSKTYHGHREVLALDNLTFQVNQGEVIVVIGPNGAGKSTLINLLAGATEPSRGAVSILGGEETGRFTEVQRYLGVCLQENILIDLLSVREHFELFGAFRGVDPARLDSFIDFFCHELQMTHMLANRAGDLSGGQKRKLCIALALLGGPPLVIMDEPTAGVDVQARMLIWKMISNLKGTTSIITSHALEEAETVSSRLFIMAGGKIEYSGTATELRSEFKCGYLLRVQREDGTAGPVVELAQSFVPTAKLTEDRQDTIALPVDPKIPEFLQALAEKETEYGIQSYSFSIEELEDTMLRLIQNGELGQ